MSQGLKRGKYAYGSEGFRFYELFAKRIVTAISKYSISKCSISDECGECVLYYPGGKPSRHM
jgi:hypothetical protein